MLLTVGFHHHRPLHGRIAVAEGQGCALYRSIGAVNSHSHILNMAEYFYEEEWEDEIELKDYYPDFVKFVGARESGVFMVVVTVGYDLPLDVPVEDVLTVWSPPQQLSVPLRECFERGVQPFANNFLRRLENGRLIGLSFRWGEA